MRCLAFCSAFLLLVPPAAWAAQWRQIGPYGGDVRSLAADPVDFSRLFLGTSNGQIYASTNGGRSWIWWSQVAPQAGYVVDDILVDAANPDVMYVGAWRAERSGDGGVFQSTDGGRSWRALPDMAGRSVRALVQARHQPHLLVAGTLEGVFRSRDAGRSWERISPPYHQEIRNIESLALDPHDPQVIYAGTWHLPWKTSDGGLIWRSIKKGMMDDSDIFSILVDRSNPSRVFASTCSGIYQTDSAGAAWRKIQGIPYSARRTRVLRQNPVNPALLYAGTTEGLWKTESGGRAWRRMTSPRLVINDILIDPREPAHLLLGIERAGVLESFDGGKTFRASNRGFSHRHVSAAAFDPGTGRLYAAVVHDREYGGVFFSEDGDRWQQLQAGLDSEDVLALVYARTAEGGRLLAGLRNGVAALDPAADRWSRIGRVVLGWRPPPTRRDRQPRRPRLNLPLKAAVHDFFQAAPGQPLYVATSTGVFKSTDAGSTWEAVSRKFSATAIAAEGEFLVAGTQTGLELSFNGGGHWFHIYLPVGIDPVHVNALAVHGKRILAATSAGLFLSTDSGARWRKKGQGLPYGAVSSVRMHPTNPREVYVASRIIGTVYVSQDGGRTFRPLERQGLVGKRVGSLEILPRNSSPHHWQLLLASESHGLFRRPLEPSATVPSQQASTGQQGQ